MPQRAATPGNNHTLHNTLLGAAMVLVGLAATVMVGSVSLAIAWRDAGERENTSYVEDQRIADDVRALAQEQQLSAYRYLQSQEARDLDAFRARGDEAYRRIHEYLFRPLAMDIRLSAEKIKEAHQQFEVAAERTFARKHAGEVSSALVRLDSMDVRASALNTTISGFLHARSIKRDAAEAHYAELSQRLRFALAALTIIFVIVGIMLAGRLRRMVLRPLEDLASAAERLGTGDADSRVPAQPYREFDAVATVFNQMAHRIQLSAENSVAQNRELQDTLDHLHETQEEMVQLEKLSAMGQMLAGLAHELNNPLGGILGMAECLRLELSESSDALTREMGRELAVPLEREALRAKALVRSLLSFSRKPAAELTPVDLSVAVHTAVGLRAHAFAELSKRIRVDVPAGHNVMGDAQKLQHSVVNIMNNALDALVDGNGTLLDIHITSEDPDHTALSFDDDGTGIVDVDAAFRPFFTTKEAGKGTGLGLPLVKRFMTEFGGTVSASNRAGGGARVTLTFRRSAVTPRPISTATGEWPADVLAARDASLRRTTKTGRKRILVVDDEPAIREIERRALTRAGYDVVVAASGTDARDIMLRESIDLVVSDLRMPGAMDGRALFEWMCVERVELSKSALLVTGNMSGVEFATLPMPPHRTISKPFVGAELVARVQAALETPGTQTG